MLRIALTGTHGVGKTTLANALRERIVARRGPVVAVTPEASRLIGSLTGDAGFYRRSNNNPLRQTLVVFSQLVCEETASDGCRLLICDRALLDHWAYSKHLFAEAFRAAGVLELYEHFVAERCSRYDKLFYVPIERAPIDDGTREDDPAYQTAVDDRIVSFLHEHALDYVTVSGTLDERCARVESELYL